MRRHGNSRYDDRFAVTQPVCPPCTLFDPRKQLTAAADRAVRDAPHAIAFSAVVAVGGVGSVYRRTARAFSSTATVKQLMKGGAK